MNKATTVRDFIEDAAIAFTNAHLFFGHGTDNAKDEALWLCMHVLNLTFEDIIANMDKQLTLSEKKQLTAFIKQRISTRKPLAYLIHEAWFANDKYYIDENVIVPRSPLAELIVTNFASIIKKPPKNILDLCTGSGCIGIACAKYCNEAFVDLVDISIDALKIAQKNVLLHNVESRVKIIESDLFNSIKPTKKYDLIISNPPYVSMQEMQKLPKEFLHEPKLALEATDNGLSIAKRILFESSKYLNKNGFLIVEVGNSWKNLIKAYPTAPFVWLKFKNGGDGVFLLGYNDLIKHFAKYG